MPRRRLTRPLLKRNGQLVEASWPDALEAAANGLQKTLRAQGPQALGFFSCSKATNEVNYLAQKFLRALGSNNIDSCNRT